MLTGFTAALLLITISELGDKTFFIGMILAMRYSRRWVLAGVVTALVAMTLLSVLIGQAIAFLPPIYIHYAEIILFLAFGTKLLIEAWRMPATATSEVIEEAEETIEGSAKNLQRNPQPLGIFFESFLLTFIAEWGDRTQIATIALAASNNVVGVILGAILGHTICALIAVMGGKWIAGRISERAITAIGGVLFFVFAGVAWLE
ncbi:MAG: TMEM165/GDT1 family protein [Merismopediaceae bacterium]|nr:TMEM165/GDT1 family protein [Merismopediaceae bacterium]